MSIEEGNKLIAEFDGWVQDVKIMNNPYWHPERNLTMYTYPDGFKYHSSWDWLMPVVQKIISMDFFSGYRFWVSDALRTADISKIRDAVIDFITELSAAKEINDRNQNIVTENKELREHYDTLHSLMLSGEKRGHDKSEEQYRQQIADLERQIKKTK